MRTFISFIVAIVLSIGQMAAQTNPDEKSIVNKKYDENGNLIQYDSTYVQSWSSDSTFNFPLDGSISFGEGFPDMDQFFRDFFGDSMQFRNNFPENFFHSPFQDEEFFKQFGQAFPDSLFMGARPFGADSLMKYRFGFNEPFPNAYGFGDWQELEKQFRQHAFPKFTTPEQQEEWEKLLEKQQREKDEFLERMEKEKK